MVSGGVGVPGGTQCDPSHGAVLSLSQSLHCLTISLISLNSYDIRPMLCMQLLPSCPSYLFHTNGCNVIKAIPYLLPFPINSLLLVMSKILKQKHKHSNIGDWDRDNSKTF